MKDVGLFFGVDCRLFICGTILCIVVEDINSVADYK